MADPTRWAVSPDVVAVLAAPMASSSTTLRADQPLRVDSPWLHLDGGPVAEIVKIEGIVEPGVVSVTRGRGGGRAVAWPVATYVRSAWPAQEP